MNEVANLAQLEREQHVTQRRLFAQRGQRRDRFQRSRPDIESLRGLGISALIAAA
jgi:hypothetical protein